MHSRWTLLCCLPALLAGCHHDLDMVPWPVDHGAQEAGPDIRSSDGDTDGVHDGPAPDRGPGFDASKEAGGDAGKEAGKEAGIEAGGEAGVPPTKWTTLTPGGSGTYSAVVAQGAVVLVGTTMGDLLRSDNSGAKFSPVLKVSGAVEEIDLDGNRAVAISGEGNLHYSIDGGLNWSASKPGCGKGATSVALVGLTAVAGCAGKRCVSSDGGKNYACTDVKVGMNLVLFHGVAAAKVGADTVLLAAGHYMSGAAKPVIHRWDSKSKAWADLTATLPIASGQLFHADLVPTGLAAISATQGNVLYSSDGGKNWGASSPGTAYISLRAVAVSPPGLVLAGAASSQKGVYLSTNGGGYFTQLTDPALNQGGYAAAAFDGQGGAYMAGKVLIKGIP